MQAIVHHHRRVRFLSTIELANALEQEKLNARPGRLTNRLAHVDLVILDELDYLPFSQTGGALLFHLLSKLYERTRLIITTNLSNNRLNRVGYFSMQNPGKLSVQINSPAIFPNGVRWSYMTSSSRASWPPRTVLRLLYSPHAPVDTERLPAYRGHQMPIGHMP